MQRVAWLQSRPNGVLCEKQSRFHRIVIYRDNDLLRMCFLDLSGGGEEPGGTGAMSALSLQDPLDLSPTPYNQAMMLALLWRREPARIYVAGFGGGRMPLAFHHYFPRAVIDSTEIDRAVCDLARSYFAIECDHRQRIHIMDAREFLEKAELGTRYDLILIDAFCGGGEAPRHLGTKEFYRACKMRLRNGGVVATNLVDSDPAFGPRLAALAFSFENVYVQRDRTTVAFAVHSPAVCREAWIRRAEAIRRKHNFAFAFVQRALTRKPLREVGELRALVDNTAALTDAFEPPGPAVRNR